MMRRSPALIGLGLVCLALLFFLGCGGGGYGGGSYGGGGGGGGGGGMTGIATNIMIAPVTASVTVSGMQTYTAVSKDANGNVLTGVSLVWHTSNPSVATINSGGVATGVAVGTTSITASVTYSGGIYGTGATYTSNMATLTVTAMNDVMGVVATGHALAGAVVTLKDVSGKSQTGMSDAGGHFQLSVAGMQGPFLVRADDGRGHSLFGATAAAGVANVDTVTDLMLRAYYADRGSTPEQAFMDMGAHPAPDAKTLEGLDHSFNGVLRDALAMEGVDPDKFSLFATPFTANSTGFDAVLDNVSVAAGRTLELQDGLMGRTTEVNGLGK